MKNLLKYALMLCIYFNASSSFANPEFGSDLTSGVTASGIDYVNGGIAHDQQHALRSMRKDYNLQLTFAEKGSGVYIADVHLSIENMSGKEIFRGCGAGPMVLVKLAPGKYQIIASYGDQTQKKMVNVNERGTRDVYFYW